jgi:two-component system response regulator HydG
MRVNVRLISATNRDLSDAIAAGSFRQDLYHRLKVVTIKLPALRDRKEDIPLLVDHFLKIFSTSHEKKIRGYSPSVRRILTNYAWPGNVRELRNVVESMVVIDHDGMLDIEDLPDDLAVGINPSTDDVVRDGLVGKSMLDIEKHFIVETLKASGGNREEAAKTLGIGERTLYRKIKEYNLG